MFNRILPGIAALLLAAPALAQTAPLPEGAIRAGTLSNQILIRDTLPHIIITAQTQGCTEPQGADPFVKADPSGAVGQRQWQEIWVIRCSNQSYPVAVTFRESPTGAYYTIH